MNATYSAFLAHPKALDDETIDALCERTRALLSAALPDRAVRVVPGRDDYNATFRRAGTWNAWARDVACGIEYGTGAPRYSVLVVAPDASVGKATETILRLALQAGKPVLLLTPDGFAPVRSLATPDHGGDFYVSAVCVS